MSTATRIITMTLVLFSFTLLVPCRADDSPVVEPRPATSAWPSGAGWSPTAARTTATARVATTARPAAVRSASTVKPGAVPSPAVRPAEAAAAAKPKAPVKQWVWLEKQGVWGYGYQITSGPYKGLWRIDPGTKCEPAPEPTTDPHGFTAMLNRLRTTVGLRPVAFDLDLTAWAAQNNAAQVYRGLGHHVNPNCYQNSAWNTPDASSTLATWLNSPGHRENLLAPEITRVGLAHGPGPYWTMNAR